MSEKKIATNCSDCGCQLTKAHEVADGMCWMCGPGSAKYQQKNPGYVHGQAAPEASAAPTDGGLKFCRISGLPLTMAHELELELHHMHGPGSTNWKLAHPEYEHSAAEYEKLVAEFKREKLVAATNASILADEKKEKKAKSKGKKSASA